MNEDLKILNPADAFVAPKEIPDPKKVLFGSVVYIRHDIVEHRELSARIDENNFHKRAILATDDPLNTILTIPFDHRIDKLQSRQQKNKEK